jgi:Arm DNA-binding domain
MPRVKLTKSVIDDLPTPAKDVVYWDAGCPGFGVKVTPAGGKVFVVLFRTGGAGSRLRKYTIGPYGRVTLHQARVSAQKVFAARLEGRDLAAEKHDARKRMVADRVDDLLEARCAEPHGSRDVADASARIGSMEYPKHSRDQQARRDRDRICGRAA